MSISNSLHDELLEALKIDSLPETFATSIDAALLDYVQVRRERPRGHGAGRLHPREFDWVLRIEVFSALDRDFWRPAVEALHREASELVDEAPWPVPDQRGNVFRGRKSPAAKVLRAVMREADRLEGRPPRSAVLFSNREWKLWLLQYSQEDEM